MAFALCLDADGDPGSAEARIRAALEAVAPGHPPMIERSGPLVAGQAGAGVRPSGPRRRRADGPLLVGDLGLARAAELAGRLGVAPGPDADLVLQAHDLWGPAAGERLEGLYAFALWDPAERRLWAARDLWGVKPLFVRRAARTLHCADSIAALLAMHDAPPEPDETWVAEFLAGHRMSPERTPFRGIARLPPGHALLARVGEVRIERQRALWSLAAPALTADEVPEALRHALDAAVGRALRQGPSAAMLSGGLDSGALAALGARNRPDPLPTYSLVFPDRPEIDERRWIDAVLASGRFRPRFVPIEGPGALAQSGLGLATREHPADGYGHGRLDRLMAAAAADGIRGLLDGHGGDEVISSGIGRLGELAAGRRLLALWRATGGIAPLAGLSRGRLALAALATDAPDRLARAAARCLAGGRPDPGERLAWRRMVRDDLARRSGLVERARTPAPLPSGATAEAVRHLALLDPVTFADGFESLARLARPHGVEPRFPFFDERVVAICLSRPAAEKLRDGQSRALLRRAMAGLLPDAVRLRAAKTDFRSALAAELTTDRNGRLARLLGPGDHAVAAYADMAALRGVAERIGAGGAEARDLTQAWRVLSLADWLARLDGAEPGGGTGRES